MNASQDVTTSSAAAKVMGMHPRQGWLKGRATRQTTAAMVARRKPYVYQDIDGAVRLALELVDPHLPRSSDDPHALPKHAGRTKASLNP